MINESILAVITGVAAAGIASPAFAQSFEVSMGTGNILPMVYDTQGGEHVFVYGYYGPLVPAITPQNDQIAVRQSRLLAYSAVPRTQSTSNLKRIQRSQAGSAATRWANAQAKPKVGA